MSALPYNYCAGLTAKSLVVVAAFAFAVGTGGYSTAEYFIARGTKGYAYAAEEPKVIPNPVKAIAKSADADVLPQHTRDIRDIKEFPKLSALSGRRSTIGKPGKALTLTVELLSESWLLLAASSLR
jgi:hypothetical protein